MCKIRIHNPCNEHTRYFRRYNFFWDKFTDFLKTKFDVEENRYYENAHIGRLKVNLSKGDSNQFLLQECEYVIENLENGEFVILSVSDDLGSGTLSEIGNPLLKKVLISQFIPEKIKSHTYENYYKYSPWTYFQCDMTDLEFYYDKRKKIHNKIDKLYFRGEEMNRPILNHFNNDILYKPNKTHADLYFDEVINYSIGLSIAGVGEMCYRDIEYMSLGIPFIRFEYQTTLDPPLIPNYHYISIPYDETIPKHNGTHTDRLGDETHVKKIEEKFLEVINNKSLLDFIGRNARKYYEDNLMIDSSIKNTYRLLDIDKWLNKNKKMVAVQIGSNKGYDDFTELIKDKQIDKLVLIEPFEEHNESLKSCYSNFENVSIENIIITDNPNNETDEIFYHIEDTNHGNRFELASLNKLHSLNIRSNYDESGIQTRSLKSMTINQLLNKYNIKDLDVLFIDTEGFDDKIIKSINFDEFNIKEIYYENLHIDVNQLRNFLNEKKYVVESGVGFGGWTDYAKIMN